MKVPSGQLRGLLGDSGMISGPILVAREARAHAVRVPDITGFLGSLEGYSVAITGFLGSLEGYLSESVLD